MTLAQSLRTLCLELCNDLCRDLRAARTWHAKTMAWNDLDWRMEWMELDHWHSSPQSASSHVSQRILNLNFILKNLRRVWNSFSDSMAFAVPSTQGILKKTCHKKINQQVQRNHVRKLFFENCQATLSHHELVDMAKAYKAYGDCTDSLGLPIGFTSSLRRSTL